VLRPSVSCLPSPSQRSATSGGIPLQRLATSLSFRSG
jgi:hypothetical protein